MDTVTTPAIAPDTLFSPVSQEIAEDRWLGLMLDRGDPDAPSDLSDRLVVVLGELAGGMGRTHASDSGTVDDLDDVLREWLVTWAVAGGVSPDAPRAKVPTA